jgi:hypothetical protein
MDVIILWVLPALLSSLECLFVRRCVIIVSDELRYSGYKDQVSKGHKMPRIKIAMLLLASFIPFLGITILLVLTIEVTVRLSSDVFDIDYCWVVRENRFTKYWFKS